MCSRVLRVDHVEKYKIPKEFLDFKDDEDLDEKELYKPTGPDGLGWGEFRKLTETDVKRFEEMKSNEVEKQLISDKRLDKTKFIMDEDERVYYIIKY